MIIERKVVAYWNLYDFRTGIPLDQGNGIERNAFPHIGDLTIGIPGRFQIIVRDIKFRGFKGEHPCFDVYV